MGGIDKDTEDKEKQTRIQAAAQRKMKEEKRKQRVTETIQLESSSSESNVEVRDEESIADGDFKSSKGPVDSGPSTYWMMLNVLRPFSYCPQKNGRTQLFHYVPLDIRDKI